MVYHIHWSLGQSQSSDKPGVGSDPMKRILVTGAAGQIGSDLVPALRARYGSENVVAAGFETSLHDDVQESGPCTTIDVTDFGQVSRAMREYEVDTLFHMSSILSAVAEGDRRRAHEVNINGLHNVLEAAAENGLERVVAPSSIAAFGDETPKDPTPNDTIQKPTTVYGISKVYGELLGNYYSLKVGLQVRGVRLPGLVSWKTPPTAGTTDYTVAIFYGAIQEGRYTCYLKPGTYLPIMYMPDALDAIIGVAEADSAGLKHHADFNVNALSFEPEQLAAEIRARIPGFTMDYDIDPLRQSIADSWPDSLDDTVARAEWGWDPKYDLSTMVDDMLENLRRHLAV